MTVAAAQPGNAGMYDVVITNSCGASTSASVSVTVFRPVLSLGQTGPGGGYSLTTPISSRGASTSTCSRWRSCAAGVGERAVSRPLRERTSPLSCRSCRFPSAQCHSTSLRTQVSVLFGPFFLQPGLHFEGLCFRFHGRTLNGYSQVAALDTLYRLTAIYFPRWGIPSRFQPQKPGSKDFTLVNPNLRSCAATILDESQSPPLQ